jgi:hypothetical protein
MDPPAGVAEYVVGVGSHLRVAPADLQEVREKVESRAVRVTQSGFDVVDCVELVLRIEAPSAQEATVLATEALEQAVSAEDAGWSIRWFERVEEGGKRTRLLVRFLTTPAGVGVLSMLLAGGAAAGSYLSITGPELFDWCHATRGASIPTAITVAFLGSLAVSLVVVLVRKRRRLLVAALLAGGAALGVALALVARDSATYRSTQCPAFLGPNTSVERGQVWYLYVFWGTALAMLLVQASRAWHRGTRFRT